MKQNVIEKVVRKKLCIGCGVCASFCPANALEIGFNSQGNYEPFERVACPGSCKICLDVCPFHAANENEDQLAARHFETSSLQHSGELGYYLRTLLAYRTDDKQRLRSASGGLGFWLLARLLELKRVDYVAAPRPNPVEGKLFTYDIFSCRETLSQSRGSVYYPVELSGVMDFVRTHDATFAIAALPCYAKAIRLAQGKDPRVRQRVRYIVGLVCGQTKNRGFAEALGKIATGSSPLKGVNFRTKQPANPSSNFAFSFEAANGKQATLSWNGCPSRFWGNRLFTPTACNYCDDLFAETADIALMDAWLPKYTSDYRGHSLAVLRNAELLDLFDPGARSLHCEDILPKAVIDSQRGALNAKRGQLAHRLSRGESAPVIAKRIKPRRGSLYLAIEVAAKDRMQRLSSDYENNRGKIACLAETLKMVTAVRNAAGLAVKSFVRLLKILRGKDV